MDQIVLSVTVQVQVALPKKRGLGATKGYNDAFQRFLLRTYEAVVAHVRLDVVKCLLIAGPGFAKDSFREFLLDQANKAGNKELLAFKQSIFTAQASTAYLQGVEVCHHSPIPLAVGEVSFSTPSFSLSCSFQGGQVI